MANYHSLIKAIDSKIEEAKYCLLNNVNSLEEYKFYSGKINGLYIARTVLTEQITKSDDNDQ
jgi:hypothetical protein